MSKKTKYKYQQANYWQDVDKFAEKLESENVNVSTTRFRDIQMTETAGSEVDEKEIELNSYSCTDYKDWMLDFNSKIYDAMKENESNIVTHFKLNQSRQLALFVTKHSKYGTVNILEGESNDPVLIRESLNGLCIRMRDKLNRLKNLIESGDDDASESIEDTLTDLANYANIGVIVYAGEWHD